MCSCRRRRTSSIFQFRYARAVLVRGQRRNCSRNCPQILAISRHDGCTRPQSEVRHESSTCGCPCPGGIGVLARCVRAARQKFGGYAGITVYEHPDFRGDSVTFRNEVADLRQHGLNDRISSLEVDGNQAWEVCRDVNFGGGCRVFQGTIENLRSEGLERSHLVDARRRIRARQQQQSRRGVGQSARQREQPPVAAGALRSSELSAVTHATSLNSSNNLGSVGDRARSVQVYGGTWELCDGASRNARCVTVSAERSGSAQPRPPQRRGIGREVA